MLWRANAVIKDEGFIVHPDKTRIMRRGARQEVTGLVVNENSASPATTCAASVPSCSSSRRTAPKRKTWRGSSSRILAVARGYANFIHMVDPEKARPIYERVNALLAKHGWQQEIRHPAKPPASSTAAESSSGNKGPIPAVKSRSGRN